MKSLANRDVVREILACTRITEIATALGVQVRRGRCVCPWRARADGWNVALSDAKGTWFDHARGEGGGVLDFVARVRACGRQSALRWLAAHVGLCVDDWGYSERRQWLRRMEEAAKEAVEL